MKKIIVIFSLFLFVLTACKNKPKHQKKLRGEPISTYFGGDFSHNQKADWAIVDTQTKYPNTTFFIFRTWREGNRRDTLFQKNFIEAKRRGYIVAGYQFFDPNIDPVVQTNNYIACMDSVNLGEGDFRPILDVEKLSDTLVNVMRVISNLKKDTAQLRILKMVRLDTVELLTKLRDTLQLQFIAGVKTSLSILEGKYGVRPILYCNLNFFKENLKDSFGFDYPLWIAAYDCDRKSDPIVMASSIHQTSDKIKFPGIKGNIDGNEVSAKALDSLLLKK
jgi:lysozyme